MASIHTWICVQCHGVSLEAFVDAGVPLLNIARTREFCFRVGIGVLKGMCPYAKSRKLFPTLPVVDADLDNKTPPLPRGKMEGKLSTHKSSA